MTSFFRESVQIPPRGGCSCTLKVFETYSHMTNHLAGDIPITRLVQRHNKRTYQYQFDLHISFQCWTSSSEYIKLAQFLGIQDFDFAQIYSLLPKCNQISPQICLNLINFNFKFLLGDIQLNPQAPTAR